MSKATSTRHRSTTRRSRPWSAQLATMAAERRTGDELVELLIEAGFGDKPKMTIVVKRPRKAVPKRERSSDPLEWRDADKYAYLQDDFAGMLIAV